MVSGDPSSPSARVSKDWRLRVWSQAAPGSGSTGTVTTVTDLLGTATGTAQDTIPNRKKEMTRGLSPEGWAEGWPPKHAAVLTLKAKVRRQGLVVT